MTGCSLLGSGRIRTACVRASVGILLLAVVAGCGGPRMTAPRTEFIPFSPEQKATLEAEGTRAYRIQEGDILRVYFAYERNLNQDWVHVLSDGSVSLVGIDPVKLAGMTMTEADSVITLAYSREYREPKLSVMIQESKGRRIYVLGEVRDPGVYMVPHNGIDVVSAVAMASGFTEDAAKSGTVVVRVTKEGYQFQEVNLEEFGQAAFAANAVIPLESFDIIYVPRSRVGDFGYFAKNVLSGVGYLSRIAYDIYNVSRGVTGRY